MTGLLVFIVMFFIAKYILRYDEEHPDECYDDNEEASSGGFCD